MFLKGLIARDLWELNEYFQVIYEEDPVVLKAVELLQNKNKNDARVSKRK